jgi:hypothetical protein
MSSQNLARSVWRQRRGCSIAEVDAKFPGHSQPSVAFWPDSGVCTSVVPFGQVNQLSFTQRIGCIVKNLPQKGAYCDQSLTATL